MELRVELLVELMTYKLATHSSLSRSFRTPQLIFLDLLKLSRNPETTHDW